MNSLDKYRISSDNIIHEIVLGLHGCLCYMVSLKINRRMLWNIILFFMHFLSFYLVLEQSFSTGLTRRSQNNLGSNRANIIYRLLKKLQKDLGLRILGNLKKNKKQKTTKVGDILPAFPSRN